MPALDADEIRRWDDAHLWHPWSPAGQRRPIFVSGQGCRVVDSDGRSYLDAKGGALNAACGYAHPRIVEAITDQTSRLMIADLASVTTIPAVRLARRYATLLPAPLSRTFFCSSGSEATETAVKLARMYHALRGEPERNLIVSLDRGYHGATMGAMALTSAPFVLRMAGDPPPGFHAIAAPTRERVAAAGPQAAELADELEHLVRRVGADRVAAFIMEPILGIAGVVVPPLGYLSRIREICRRHGILLILDEVLTGFGRTGSMWGMSREEVIPDIVTTSKGLTGGYLPLSAVTATDAIYRTMAQDPLLGGFRHGHTVAGHPVACAAALAVIDVIEEENLVAASARIGHWLLKQLDGLVDGDFVLDVRGSGLLIGVEFRSEADARQVTEATAELGVLVRQEGAVVTLCPPLTISDDEAATVATALGRAVSAGATRGEAG